MKTQAGEKAPQLNPRRDAAMSSTNTEKGQVRRRATINDILGHTNGSGISKIDRKWKRHHDMLLKLREDLRSHRGNRAESAKLQPSVFSLHSAEAASDQYETDFALSLLSSEQNAVYEIDEALSRIRNGTYGICELTEKPIEEERLEAIPWTRFSAAAQRELEQRGVMTRTKLAERQMLSALDGASEKEDEADEEETTAEPARR
jgi:DnaK suppressor protein